MDTIYGNNGQDEIHGGAGDDWLYGGGGSDRILGEQGTDSIDGGDHDDIIAGDEAEFPFQSNRFRTIPASNGAKDIIQGGAGHDWIFGGEGGDEIKGNDGNDIIISDLGEITLLGETIQRVRSLADNDISGVTNLASIGGNDVIFGNADHGIIVGGVGLDTIEGNDGNDSILGDNGVVVRNDGSAKANDLFTTDPAIGTQDIISGGKGIDIILGGGGGDEISGGGAGDQIFGGDDSDVLHGSDDGADSIDGGAGDDMILGHSGNDTLNGGLGNDRIHGGPGDDILAGGDGNDLLLGDTNHDVLYGNSAATMGAANEVDHLYGDLGTNGNEAGSGNDRLFGQAGNDFLFGEGGDDWLDAGAGAANLTDYGTGEGANPQDFATPAVTPNPNLQTATNLITSNASLSQGTADPGRWGELMGSAAGSGLNGDPGLSIEPAVAVAASGAVFVAWSDLRHGNYEIYLARYMAEGGWQQIAGSASGGGLSNTAGSSRRPSVTVDANGNPIIAWTEFTGERSDIRVVRWDPTTSAWLSLVL